MLGICRGMQLMAVHAGGTLDQHTPDLVGHEEHSPGGDVFGDGRGGDGRRARGWPGWSAPRVERQLPPPPVGARATPASTAVARAADGTLEAMEAPGDRFCVAVQWHPETAADVGLLAGLVRAASEFATTRTGEHPG